MCMLETLYYETSGLRMLLCEDGRTLGMLNQS
jgi:hypothetical protein